MSLPDRERLKGIDDTQEFHGRFVGEEVRWRQRGSSPSRKLFLRKSVDPAGMGAVGSFLYIPPYSA